jgi:catechol 2,3-dioxygenase-like lactoylglutathione lyase family enzyme
MAQLHPTGVHHLALSTRDMKGQLEFWCDVLGCPVKALYWMHGVENTFHGFVELAGDSYVAFVQHPDNAKDVQLGVTHAGNPAGPVTAGTMQHVAFNVDSLDDLLALRDRIRSRGVQVLGPIDHGMCQSMYFAGPEGLALEISTGGNIDARAWIDPEVQGLCKISDDELEALKSPARYERPAQPVAQPTSDPAKPQMVYPTKEIYEAVIGTSDQQVWDQMSVTEPPVKVD